MPDGLVQQTKELSQVCAKIEAAEYIALDTEFIRQSTFRPQLCLIQIAVGDEIYCIDPLAIDDLSPLMRALSTVLVIIHSARQDIEAIYQSTSFMLAPIFDTQIAAGLVGLGDQMSYSALVKELLDVDLGKGETRTNWAQRPLTDAQKRYAEDDVRYLLQLYQPLMQDLEQQQRTPWHQQECLALESPKLYEPDLNGAWKKVKGTRILDRAQRRVMKRLATWRELQAIDKNKPRKWIMSDADIVLIASTDANSEDELGELFNPKQRFLRHQSHELWQQVLDAQNDPVEEPYAGSDAREIKLTKLCMADIRKVAEQNNISPALLGTRKDVAAVIKGHESQLLETWRAALIGDRILKTIDAYDQNS